MAACDLEMFRFSLSGRAHRLQYSKKKTLRKYDWNAEKKLKKGLPVELFGPEFQCHLNSRTTD
jgi:hypothetical protein